MGKKYFNRRCQGTIRINQRRFSLQIRSNYAYTDRNVKAQKRIFVKRFCLRKYFELNLDSFESQKRGCEFIRF